MTSSSGERAPGSTRNNVGDLTASGHARDADVILGDNADVFRLVTVVGASTAYVRFTYD